MWATCYKDHFGPGYTTLSNNEYAVNRKERRIASNEFDLKYTQTNFRTSLYMETREIKYIPYQSCQCILNLFVSLGFCLVKDFSGYNCT